MNNTSEKKHTSKPADDEPTIKSNSPDSILESIQKVLNHDMPNQLLALRGWINLLETDEKDQLSESGQQYLVRLIASVERAQNTINLMADFARLTTNLHRLEKVNMEDFIAELQGNVESVVHSTKIQWKVYCETIYVRASRKLLISALTELICLIVRNPADEESRNSLRVKIGCRKTTGGALFWVKAANEILEKTVEKRLEYLYAREVMKLCSGSFQIQSADDVDYFLLFFPCS